MKKTVYIFGICLIMISQTVISTDMIERESSWEIIKHHNNEKHLYDNPPDWANGRFNGTWGLSVLGVPTVELGWIEGYYFAAGIFGRLEGYFSEWKDEEAVSFIAGYILLYNMVGYVGSIENPENGTFFSGLGAPTENGEFYYRINLIVGPGWYIEGTWEEL